MPFVPLARTDEIPTGKGQLVERDGRAVAIFNAGDGRFHATSPCCPHEDGPLAEGWLEGDTAVCPWHGFDFDLASGRCLVAPDLSISVYPVRVVGDVIEVDLP
jgi:3-phenylpropionate/trans-cinnamate dioxygenase ferredoxin component